MKIGVIKDPKQGEGRVGMTPENVKILTAEGHQVLVDKDAGVGAGFSNEEYEAAGGEIVDTKEAWSAELIVKVKEPMPSEYQYFKENQIIWGFLHLAANKECTEKMMAKNMTALSAENLVVNGVQTLLKPMSAIAGRRAVSMGQYYLEAQHQGEGILLAGIPGIKAGKVVILGGGNAAQNSCDMALAIGCEVVILEKSPYQIEQLKQKYTNDNVLIVPSSEESLAKYIKEADLFISTVLIPGAKPPKLVKDYMVASMKKGSVLVDIAIDQGGTVENIKTTNHAEPVYINHGVVHYAVPNMPGAVPRTATIALSKGNIEYLVDIANNGIKNILQDSKEIASAASIYEGTVVSKALSDSVGVDYKPLGDVL